jgi:hypothetical protein
MNFICRTIVGWCRRPGPAKIAGCQLPVDLLVPAAPFLRLAQVAQQRLMKAAADDTALINVTQ